jgi:hypothetical protein
MHNYVSVYFGEKEKTLCIAGVFNVDDISEISKLLMVYI